MSKLRELARGQPCMIRIPGVCNGNPETTVLAHYRMAGLCGTGQKPIDECGAWACSSCHDLVDGRKRASEVGMTYREIDLCFAQGVMRTLDSLHKLGYSMQPAKTHSKRKQ